MFFSERIFEIRIRFALEGIEGFSSPLEIACMNLRNVLKLIYLDHK